MHGALGNRFIYQLMVAARRVQENRGGVRGTMGWGEIVRIILESLLSRSLGDKSLNY